MIGFQTKSDVWYFAMIRDVGACCFQVSQETDDHLAIISLTYPAIQTDPAGQVQTVLRKWPGHALDWTKTPLHVPKHAISCIARASENLSTACAKVWSLVHAATPAEVNRLRHLEGGNGRK